ncbi:MAG: MATE family efflux transporter [Firmicutes bacterium]|nr:MATE family efflux transporter [Bacillota bacterium]
MAIQLSEHFNFRKLLRFTMPSIFMMIFTSIYGVVDGIFVSNFVGKTAFAAVNLIIPFCMLLGSLGMMIGTGGSALVAKLMGEGKQREANRAFSLLIYFSLVFGIVLSVLGFIFVRPISEMLGAEGQMLEDCVLYGRVLLPATVFFILQTEFQSFMVAAEKPKFGLAITVGAGLTNMLLDFLFIAVFDWDLVGAALATAISQLVGGGIPLCWFIFSKKSMLRLGRTNINCRYLLKACTNGSSEMMTNVSMSLVNILYNWQLLEIAGENGVAAYGVIMYVNFIFVAAFIGYSIGCGPIISYHYGAQNHDELQNLYRKSLTVISLFGIAMTLSSILLAHPLASIFVSYDFELMEMTKRGLIIYSFSFIFAGYNIFGSAFFTALNNGLVSAGISFLRTLLFQVIAILILPALWGLDGIWMSINAAEGAALMVTICCFIFFRRRYHY